MSRRHLLDVGFCAAVGLAAVLLAALVGIPLQVWSSR